MIDPRMLGFICARYKFTAKMLEGLDDVLEIGCGDAFGAPIVGQAVRDLTCTDIDGEQLANNTERCRASNINFVEWDFRFRPYPRNVDAIYMLDVIEHLFPWEEETFLRNVFGSMNEDGVLIIGTPNRYADRFASEHSRHGHLNLKEPHELREIGEENFRNSFMFGMNDETLHTGFAPMSHYLLLLASCPKKEEWVPR